MSQHSVYTRCPIVQRTIENFVQFVHAGGENQKVEFKKPVVWVQESASRILYIHGDKTLKAGSEYSDYYGYLSSCQHKDGEEGPSLYAGDYQITVDSSLKLVQVTTITKEPYFESEEDRAYNESRTQGQSKQLSRLPPEWRTEQKCPDSPTGLYYPALEKIQVIETETWSSKLSTEENAARLQAFLGEWAIEGY